VAEAVNDRGQVVGFSTLAGESDGNGVWHAFLATTTDTTPLLITNSSDARPQPPGHR
jgi:probable HAF family extracellular repeat protein